MTAASHWLGDIYILFIFIMWYLNPMPKAVFISPLRGLDVRIYFHYYNHSIPSGFIFCLSFFQVLRKLYVFCVDCLDVMPQQTIQNRFLHWDVLLIPNSVVKVLKNRIVLIMRVNPDVRIVSMVSVNHWLRVVNRFRIYLKRNLD